MKWKVLSSEYLVKFPFFTARKDKCETPEGKIVEQYYVVELPTTACALAFTEEGEAIMIKQYRHPVEKVILELPGGFIDQHETPEIAMARELMEETGYEFSSIQQVGVIAANPGVLNNYTALFLAQGGKKVGEQDLDHNEYIEIEKISLAEVKDLLLENKIEQALHAMCMFYALKEMGEL